MKIKKVLLAVASASLVCLVVMLNVFAHSGRTDANGGHWDRSTGTYHYHTGEYTGKSSSSSSSKKTENKTFTPPYEPPEKQVTEDNKRNVFSDILYGLLGAIIGFFPLWCEVVSCVIDFFKDLFKKRR